MPSERLITIYLAIAANTIIAIAKITVALISGSSAMISEGIHSSVDTGNQQLLLLGERRSNKLPDKKHPLGHGKEVYFLGTHRIRDNIRSWRWHVDILRHPSHPTPNGKRPPHIQFRRTGYRIYC